MDIFCNCSWEKNLKRTQNYDRYRGENKLLHVRYLVSRMSSNGKIAKITENQLSFKKGRTNVTIVLIMCCVFLKETLPNKYTVHMKVRISILSL